MQLTFNNQFFVYITTNEDKTVLHVGVTSDLSVRLYQHEHEVRSGANNPAAQNGCTLLVYWEQLPDARLALIREKELQSLNLKRRQTLIEDFNPGWRFLNEEIGTTSHLFSKTN